MTAEVAIINRHAIALAADSAVTIGRRKVWKTANKLFSLGPKHDIAIMVYGSGDFLGLPWETVVKEYRRRAVAMEFETVQDCAEDFKTFLLSSIFGRDDQQRYSVVVPVWRILSEIAGHDLDGEGADDHEDDPWDANDLRKQLQHYRREYQSASVLFPYLDSIGDFIEPFKEDLIRLARGLFGEAVAVAVEEEIFGLAYDLFRAKKDSRYSSGVVVAGFGRGEFFPCLMHYTVDGRWGNHLRWWQGDDCRNLNDPAAPDDFPIIPFAQDDMSFQFMSGISLDYLTFLRRSVTEIMTGAFEDLIKDFVEPQRAEEARERADTMATGIAETMMSKLYEKVSHEQYRPINRAVSALPKEEMAIMAEALVDITSLKRKVDSRLESVGGPVDVAVISKGDGFIWIKRKHYFRPELNQDYFHRKKAREGEGQ